MSNMSNKAKYICSMGNQFYHISIFEYRGEEYEVEYSAGGFSTFKKKSAKQQHIENQKRIDELLDNPVTKESSEESTFNLDEIWELMGWD